MALLFVSGCGETAAPVQVSEDSAQDLLQTARLLNRRNEVPARRRIIELLRPWQSSVFEPADPATSEPLRDARLAIELAQAHAFLGEFEAAVELLDRAMPDLVRHGEPLEIAAAFNLRGTNRLPLRRHLLALEDLQEAHRRYRRLGHEGAATNVLSNLGLLFVEAEQFDLALNHYERAAESWRLQGRLEDLALLKHNQAELYLKLGHYRRAIDLCEQSLEAARKWPAVHAHTLEHLGVARRELGERKVAREDLQGAVEIAEAHGFEWAAARSRVELALLELAEGARAAARRQLEAAVQSMLRLDNPQGLALTSAHLGQVALADGERRLAAGHFAMALERSAESASGDVELMARTGLAQVAFAEGRAEDGELQIERALDLLESLRRRARPGDLRAYFRAARETPYQVALTQLAATARRSGSDRSVVGRRALDLAERARARSLLDFLPRARIAGGPMPGLEVDALEDVERGAEQAAWQAALAEFRGATGDHSELYAASPASPEVVQRSLEVEDATMVHLLVSSADGLAVVTSRSGIHVVDLGPSAEIVAAAQDLRQAVQHAGRRRRARRLRGARRLYELLVEPIEEHLQHERLVLVPDEALIGLPFGVLRSPEGHLLEERWTTSLLPSASTLVGLRERARQQALPEIAHQLLLLHPRDSVVGTLDLPSVQREVQALGSALSDAVTVAVGPKDRVDSILAAAPPARVLHLVGHGKIDPQRPERSRLQWSTPQTDEVERGAPAVLDLSQIYDLELRSEVVVLSACETGLGTALAGEGFLGLARGFLHAGARALVVSLWAVDDRATALLMSSLYGGLRDGQALDQALQRARLAVRADPRFGEPYFWSGFVVVGDGAWTLKE